MDEFLRQLTDFSDLTSSFTLTDVLIVFLLSLSLNLVVAFVYKETHTGLSYSPTFSHTLVMLGTVVSFIMLIIGSNIARAFTLVGALSIVRFRNAIKESRDLGFVFFAMAVGMACGTRFYLLAVFLTVGISLAVVAMTKLDLFSRTRRERILIVRLPADADRSRSVERVLARHLARFSLISMESIEDGTVQEYMYSVMLARRADPAELVSEVRDVEGATKVSLMLGNQDLEL